MLDYDTEMLMQSFWDDMSEKLQRAVIAAVDNGMMELESENGVPEALVAGLHDDAFQEAKLLCGEDGILEPVALERDGYDPRVFKVGDEFTTFVMVRVLL